jgi:hypothetical protein
VATLLYPMTPGIYLVINGKPTEIEPQIVNWQTGGVANRSAILGIVRGDLTAKY